MSALCNNFVDALLRHYFQNAAQAGIGDTAGLLPSATAGSLYFALHTADPGDAGYQSTSEVSYAGYTRVAVARSSAGFTVSSKTVGPVAEVSFGKRTDAGSVTAYFFSIGMAATGNGTLILRGAIGSAPRLFTATGTTQIASPSHGLVLNDQVTLAPYEGATFPSSVTEGQLLWVVNPTTDSFGVATTQGGTAVTVASGQGSFQKLTPLTITQNTMPKLDPQTLIRFQ